MGDRERGRERGREGGREGGRGAVGREGEAKRKPRKGAGGGTPEELGTHHTTYFRKSKK